MVTKQSNLLEKKNYVFNSYLFLNLILFEVGFYRIMKGANSVTHSKNDNYMSNLTILTRVKVKY